MLEQLDLTRELSQDEYRARMRPLKFQMYEIGRAAGKGRAITELTARLDPRGLRVHPINPRTTREQRFPWLQRFWLKIPARGEIAIFHGSWYRRVLIDRIAKNISKQEWREGYRDIQDFERTLADDGVVIQKFWLHISPEEQLRRFQARAAVLYKQWKLTAEDWRNREKWQAYHDAVNDMLLKTSPPNAPWTVYLPKIKISGACSRWKRLLTSCNEN